MKKIVHSLFVLSLCLTTACKDGFKPISITSGKADFSTYVALGNSLTAGYQDGALFKSGQRNSYPAILAKQMEKAGRTGDFKQPLMDDNLGGLVIANRGKDGKVSSYVPAQRVSHKKLVLVEKDGQLVPNQLPGSPGTAVDNTYGLYAAQGPFNNMGVPGAKSYELRYKGYGSYKLLSANRANAYFARMASAANASILEDALRQNPTFFSLWIGSNDVLLYALDGGADNSITDLQFLATSLKALVKALTDKGAKGAIANIAKVTSIPYFTTVKWNTIGLNATQLQKLSPFVKGFNTALDALQQSGLITDAALRKLHYKEEKSNPFFIVDTDLKDISAQLMPIEKELEKQGIDPKDAQQWVKDLGQARPAHKGDILLPALGPLGKEQEEGKLGLIKPLGNKWVLTQAEAQKVATATTAYNQTIKALAQQYGLWPL